MLASVLCALGIQPMELSETLTCGQKQAMRRWRGLRMLLMLLSNASWLTWHLSCADASAQLRHGDHSGDVLQPFLMSTLRQD
jgi:hypothetical protein